MKHSLISAVKYAAEKVLFKYGGLQKCKAWRAVFGMGSSVCFISVSCCYCNKA